MGAIIEFIRAFNSPFFCLMLLVICAGFTPGGVKLHGNQYANLSARTLQKTTGTALFFSYVCIWKELLAFFSPSIVPKASSKLTIWVNLRLT